MHETQNNNTSKFPAGLERKVSFHPIILGICQLQPTVNRWFSGLKGSYFILKFFGCIHMLHTLSNFAFRFSVIYLLNKLLMCFRLGNIFFQLFDLFFPERDRANISLKFLFGIVKLFSKLLIFIGWVKGFWPLSLLKSLFFLKLRSYILIPKEICTGCVDQSSHIHQDFSSLRRTSDYINLIY